jgi:hypothetical protein
MSRLELRHLWSGLNRSNLVQLAFMNPAFSEILRKKGTRVPHAPVIPDGIQIEK